MTTEMLLALLILLGAAFLFVTERWRVDVVALLVLGSLALTRLVTPAEALAGFSNPAVVTVWALFILSGGLSRTGVADRVGQQILRLAGTGEARLLFVIMLTAGILSAVMNNVAVAALLLPVVMDIARRANRPPARLLMPLAFACLLGGTLTLIGTPANLLISDALRERGLPAFQFFDFLPLGLAVLLVGIAYMLLWGRRLLPTRQLPAPAAAGTDLAQFYELERQLFRVHVPAGSLIAGKTVAESRLGTASGLNVVGIMRDGQTSFAPSPETTIHAGDQLIVAGKPQWLTALSQGSYAHLRAETPDPSLLTAIDARLADVFVLPDNPHLGETLTQMAFRRRLGLNVLALWREGKRLDTPLAHTPLQAGDKLLVQGGEGELGRLAGQPGFAIESVAQGALYSLHEDLFVLDVPADSLLVQKTLQQSRLGDAFNLVVLAVVRNGDTLPPTMPDLALQAGDRLLVRGESADLLALDALRGLRLEVETPLGLGEVQSEAVGVLEIMLSPHSRLVGQTLSQLRFRDRYGLSVLALWRAGEAFQQEALRELPLRFGDAMLVYGPWRRLRLLADDPDILVLTQALQEPPRRTKAPLAVGIMALVVFAALLQWMPISIAAVIGAALMVLTGCLTMDEAYRFVEWKAVFLIAGMAPLGAAMQTTGLAGFLAQQVVEMVGPWGEMAVIAGIFFLTVLGSQIMPNAIVALLVAPIALTTAVDMGLSPYAMLMVVAVAVCTSFLAPVGHPANILVMGPGGYRVTDYVRVGLPLVLALLLVVLLLLPLLWPL